MKFIRILLFLYCLLSYVSIADGLSSPNLWKFPNRYRFLISHKMKNSSHLIDIKCKKDLNCLALQKKSKNFKLSKIGGSNPAAKICTLNNGKIRKGESRGESRLFCQFKDQSLIELSGLWDL